MPTLRILQISDILAGLRGINNKRIFEELISWLEREATTQDRFKEVDYIVVCGNITADGKPESFAEALDLLRNLGKRLLVKDGGQPTPRFHRMLVVPGRTDAPMPEGNLQPDLRPFKEFHDKLFAEEIKAGRASAFQAGEAVNRQLKDLTLVGVSYWELSRPEQGPLVSPLLRGLVKQIKNAREKLLRQERFEYDYFVYKPLLLVSAAYPQYTWYTRPTYEKLQSFFARQLPFSLHLFGSGTNVSILPDPFSLPHVGLGTGPRAHREFWPFRANFIEMEPEAWAGRGPEGIHRISNFVFHKLPRSSKFDCAGHIVKGKFDLFVLPQKELPQEGEAYKSFLGEVGDEIYERGKKLVFISGLPGAGKDECFRLLKKVQKLGDRQVRVFDILLTEYENEVFSEQIKEIKRKIEAAASPQQGPDVILVVRDLVYDRDPHFQKEKAADFIEKALADVFPNTRSGSFKAMLYILAGDDPPIPFKWDNKMKMKKLYLGPLRDKEKGLLVKRFSPQAPVLAGEVYNITGGLAGFEQILLTAVKESFDSLFTNADPITHGVSSRLIRDALQRPEVRNKAEQLLLEFQRERIDLAVVARINEEIKRHCNENGELDAPIGSLEIFISVADVEHSLPHGSRGKVRAALDKMSERGLLAKDEHVPDRYRVRAKGVFLSGSKWEAPAPERVNAMNISEAKVDILIVTALREEREAVLSRLTAVRLDPSKNSTTTYYSARLEAQTSQGNKGYYNVIIMSCGMGRAKAAVVTTNAINRWQPRYVCMVGIAGGFEHKGVRLGDIIIAEQVVDYELQKQSEGGEEICWKAFPTAVQLTESTRNFGEVEYGPHMPARPDGALPKVHWGDIASGDKVDTRGEVAAKYAHQWPTLIGVEMEGAGAALAVHHAAEAVRFFMVRAVSDMADKDKDKVAGKDATGRKKKAASKGKATEFNWWEHACEVAAAYAVALLRSGPVIFQGSLAQAQPAGRNSTSASQATPTAPPLQVPKAAPSQLSGPELNQLARLLVRSGQAELEGRGALCRQIGIDNTGQLSFLRRPSDDAFATDFVFWLQDTGHKEELRNLCDRIAGLLRNDYAAQVQAIRDKLA
jgi:nucleoside phosphorylase